MTELDANDADLEEVKDLFLDLNLTTNNPHLLSLIDDLFPGAGSSNIKKRRTAVSVILGAWIASLSGKGLAVERSQSAYSSDRYKGDEGEFSFRITVPVVDDLKKQGFLTERLGNQFEGRCSTYYPTDKLRSVIQTAEEVWVTDIVNGVPSIPLVVRKKRKYTVIELRDGDKNPVQFSHYGFTSEALAFLSEYNQWIIQQDVKLVVPITDKDKEGTIKTTAHQTRQAGLEGLNPTIRGNVFSLDLCPSSFCLRRIFNNFSFEKGGRYYAEFQSLSKELRPRLTINNSAVVELDYSELHPRMLYSLVGIVPSGESYLVREDGPFRDLIKKTLNSCINGSQRSQITFTLAKKLECEPSELLVDDGYSKFLEEHRLNVERAEVPIRFEHFYAISEQIISKLLDQHAAIADYLFKGYGKTLQNWDSEIATEILKRGLAEQIPVLPIHDSFIVPASNAEWLQATMLQAYKDAPFNREHLDIPIKKLSKKTSSLYLIHGGKRDVEVEQRSPDLLNLLNHIGEILAEQWIEEFMNQECERKAA